MLQGLHAAGLHGHAEHRLLPTNGADLVLLGCLLEHDHELVGDDGVEHRNDDHGEHEGDESVDLWGGEMWHSQGMGRVSRAGDCVFFPQSSRETAHSGNLFASLTLLAFEGLFHRGKNQKPLTYIHSHGSTFKEGKFIRIQLCCLPLFSAVPCHKCLN